MLPSMNLVKKQLLPHQTFLRKWSIKMRVQVSEQAYYLTFHVGDFYTVPLCGVRMRTGVTLRKVFSFLLVTS